MPETTTKCVDSCITAGNVEKAMYYKWLSLDQSQRNMDFLEVVKIGWQKYAA